MKKVLLGTTALLGASLLALPAAARAPGGRAAEIHLRVLGLLVGLQQPFAHPSRPFPSCHTVEGDRRGTARDPR